MTSNYRIELGNTRKITRTRPIRTALITGLIITGLLFPVFWTHPAAGVHSLGLIELGNATGTPGSADIVGSASQPGPDWADLFNATGGTVNLFGGVAAAFIKDDLSQASSTDQTTYSGAGTSNKNTDPISTADCANRTPPLTGTDCKPWHWDTGNIPAKDDLSNLYAYAKINPADGHLIVYAGFERIDASGDSHVDIEFLQSGIALDEALPCNDPGPDDIPCNFEGLRNVGDIIASMEFSVGGALGSVNMRRWDGTSYVLVATVGGEGCNPAFGTTPADVVCAFNNSGSIDGGPWPNYDRHGSTITNLPRNAFTEYGADITALTGGAPCLSTLIGKTRSSDSFTSELKDFAGPHVFESGCGATIGIGPSGFNEVGQPHKFTVTVNQIIGITPHPANDGTIVNVTLTDGNGASHTLLDDNCISPGTVGGTCSVTFTSNSAGTVTGNASAYVSVTGSTFFVETDGIAPNSGAAVKTFVDAKISITPDAVNEVGQLHTFTVTVQQDIGDGLGFVNAPDGTIAAVTLTDSNGAIDTVTDNTCLAGTVGGSCSITFTSDNAGIITGHASVNFTVQGVTLTRATNGLAQNSDDAVKRFQDARIAITPADVNEIGQTHTFDVTVMVDRGDGLGFVNAPDGTIVLVTLTDSNGAVSNVLVDTCATPGTFTGSCSVTFTSNTAGTVTGHASVTFTSDGVTLTRETNGLNGNSGDAVKTFVDAYITLTGNDVNEVGDTHTFTVSVQQNSGDGLGFVNAPDGTVVTVTLTDSNGAVSSIITDTCATGTLSGTCTVTFTSNSAGTITGHASVTFSVQGVSLTRSTDGTGQNSQDVVKRFVDALITIGPDGVNEVGDSHTFVVTVMVDYGDGLGFVDAPQGTEVTVTLTDENGAVSILQNDKCINPGTVLGSCSVTFTSYSAGTVTGHAVVTFTVDGVTVTRSTDGTGFNSGDAVKRFVDSFIAITPPTGVNEVGDPHSFIVAVMVDYGDGLGFVSAPDGTIVTVVLTDSNGAVNSVITDTCATGTVGGSCSITFTSDTAGIVTGQASVTFTVDGVTMTRATDGTGFNSGPASKRFEDAFITISPDDTNSVGESHTFTVTVMVDYGDGLGFVNAPDGTIVTISLTDANGAVSIILDDNCATGTVGGVCSVTFTSNTAGTVTGHASVTFTSDGVTLTRETNGLNGNSGDAVKTFVSGSITWTKVDNAGQLQGGATFEVCRTANYNSQTGQFDPIIPDCFSVSDDIDGIPGPGPDMDPAAGQFLLQGLFLGTYTIHETIAPPGFSPDPDTVTVSIDLANPDAVILEAFQNTRPILKLTEFGYTNVPVGTPTAGVISGITVYTIKIKNYGDTTAILNITLTASIAGQGTGTFTCTGGCTMTETGVSVAPGAEVTFTLTVQYTDVADGAVVSATLEAIYTLNGLTRTVSGTPATISFTVQSD